MPLLPPPPPCTWILTAGALYVCLVLNITDLQQLTFWRFNDHAVGMRSIPTVDEPHGNQTQLPGKAVFSLSEDRTALLCQETLADGALGEVVVVGNHLVYGV